MYSLVLMSAMTATPDTAGFNGFFRDLFTRGDCSGCYGCGGGAARYSCYGGCSGVSDYHSCNGCGGGLFGLRDRFRSWWNANGCCGGSYARAYGCSGIAYSCYGSAAYSCFGGPPVSYTPVFNGGLSCQGGPVPSAPTPIFEPYPTGPGIIPGTPAPTIPYADPVPAPPSVIPGSTASDLRPAAFTGTPVATVAAGQGGRATVVVRLPADAKLYADGAPLRMTGGERKFVTPELPAEMEYTYRFTVEYERNGELVSVTRKVAVRAGGTVRVEFADLSVTKPVPSGDRAAPAKGNENLAAAPVSQSRTGEPPVALVPPVKPTQPEAPKVAPPVTPAPSAPASARATITVNLPPGASLYVDGQKSPPGDTARKFTTPPLPAGREFAYLLKAEVIHNGHPEQLIQKVAFRAGEQVIVDFTGLGSGR